MVSEHRKRMLQEFKGLRAELLQFKDQWEAYLASPEGAGNPTIVKDLEEIRETITLYDEMLQLLSSASESDDTLDKVQREVQSKIKGKLSSIVQDAEVVPEANELMEETKSEPGVDDWL